MRRHRVRLSVKYMVMLRHLKIPVATAIVALLVFSLAAVNPAIAQTLDAPVLDVQVRGNSIYVNWSTVEGAARHELWTWWATDPGWQRLDNGNLTITSFEHSGLTSGTTYYYAVRSVNPCETGSTIRTANPLLANPRAKNW